MRPHPQTISATPATARPHPRHPVSAHIPTPPHSPTGQARRDNATSTPTSRIIPVRKPQLDPPTGHALYLSTPIHQNKPQNLSSSLHCQHTATTHYKILSTGPHKPQTKHHHKETPLEHLLEKPKETPYTPLTPYRKTTPKETHKENTSRNNKKTISLNNHPHRNQQTNPNTPPTKPHHTHKPRGRKHSALPHEGDKTKPTSKFANETQKG